MKMRCQKARKFISLAMDGRLEPDARDALKRHLSGCPVCREWQREQHWLRDLVQKPQEIHPTHGFHAGVMEHIAASPRRSRLFAFPAPAFRTAWLRAAALLLFVFSALIGFFLGGRMESSASGAETAAFSQALSLDAFADRPADSFGAVYERLLRGELE